MTIDDEIKQFEGLIDLVIFSKYKQCLYYIEYDYLYSEGLIGLWKGIESFDESRGITKETHYFNNIKLKISSLINRSIDKMKRKGREGVRLINIEDYENKIGYRDDMDFDVSELFEVDLTERQRFIVEKRIKGYTQKEIATMLNTSQQVISQELTRIKK